MIASTLLLYKATNSSTVLLLCPVSIGHPADKLFVPLLPQPWEIHQDLPYGTMADDEMRKLNIGCLQDDGVIFVWVTGAHLLHVICTY